MAIDRALADGLEFEPELTVTQWADQHRMLSSKSSAEPGQWRTSRTPYLREIMDHLSSVNPARRIVFMKGAQVGATECGNNWIGYVIHHAPAPFLMVQPTFELAKRVSKQRIAPMILDTPVLSERVHQARSRDAGNTMFVKEFDGGLLILTGSNSGAGLRSMPIRYLMCDEVDEYPGDVDGQGDPVSLAEKRTITFARRKVLMISTPTIKGLSRIEKEFVASDQRYYFVPCPKCGHMDYIRWENVRWETGQPRTARLFCEACTLLIEERHKTDMLARGEWRSTAPGGFPGFHLSGLYSPLGWKSWAECVSEFLESKEDPFRLKAWINTVLGETWEERGTAIEPEGLMARRERYAADVPRGVGVLVASVDVQGDRLEVVVKGYGAGEESWLIAFTQLFGDPGRPETWFELDRFLWQDFIHESGRVMRIECVTVDSGGLHTEQVYRYCKVRGNRRVYAVRGGSERGQEIVSRPSTKNRVRLPLFTLCVDTAKDMIYSRLAIPAPGPGYCHLPEWTDEEYVKQLTAERAIRKWKRGKGSIREWVKTRERNEALDLEVYALAALYIMGRPFVLALGDRAAKFNRPKGQGGPPPSPDGPATLANPGETVMRKRPTKKGWIDSWR